MMRKKLIVAALMPLFIILLTGCHLSHDWQEATCTTPRTCLTGGETKGEALGHTWVDASCTEPRHCSVCEVTEGEALGHRAVGEPTYQSPALCSVCGEAAIEPLEADFAAWGLDCDMEVGKSYDYTTACRKDHDLKTTASMVVTGYTVLTSDDTHGAKEGYEWKIVSFDLIFSDQNARDYGYIYGYQMADYYDNSLLFDSMKKDDTDDIDSNTTSYLVSFNGEEREVYMNVQDSSLGWIDHVATISVTYEFQAPVGYDGIVIHAYDGELKPDSEEEETSFDEICNPESPNAQLLFRLD